MGGRADPTFLKTLNKGETGKLLSLDGGGIKGVSTLIILEEIMDAVKRKENTERETFSDKTRLPRDYFHLAAGTSTGGIIALMLFRFGMSATQARKAYEELAPEIFQPRIWGYSLKGHPWLATAYLWAKTLGGYDRYSGENLKEAVNKIMAEHGRHEDKEDLKNGQSPLLFNAMAGRMFMCATDANRGESVLLRTYKTPVDAHPVSRALRERTDQTFRNITISDAICATSAAPTYLPEVRLDGARFWDGGLLNNNPINQLWRARFDIAKRSNVPQVSFVLSLGCSWSTAKSQSIFRIRNTVNTAASFITNTESKHIDFKRYINRITDRQGYGKIIYLRFNAPTEEKSFNLDDYEKMKQLGDITREWLMDPDVQDDIAKCVECLLTK